MLFLAFLVVGVASTGLGLGKWSDAVTEFTGTRGFP